ncbi:MAG: hypothetical protein PHO26_04100 [Dehalococcoidia bacterium]|nr:hypothetical protein [Dehalococcoidia bacterium]MDD5493195.1 hypothetical protein [Dehalococcoidia bacterium]
MGFKCVSMATKKTMNNPFTIGIWDEGALEMTTDKIIFNEKSITNIEEIKNISFVNESFHWGFTVIGIIIFVVFHYMFRGIIPEIIEALGVGLTIGPLFTILNKWIKIEYIGENNSIAYIYFKIRRIEGNTHELFSILKAWEKEYKTIPKSSM